MLRPVTCLLTLVVLLVRLNPAAFFPGQAQTSPCGAAPDPIFLPLISKAHAMAQPSILENLEEIMTADAAFPFDAIITQIFTNTVNVKPVGSRTIIRDVALPEFIKADDLQIGYPVRLGHSASKVTVEAYFEQFADPESFNYAGLGSKIPGKPTLSVQATKAGWVLTWPKVAYATKYLVYQNDTADSDSPELVQTINVTNPNLATYSLTLQYDSPFIYFAVQACNGLLEGDVSLWMTDMTPPAAPTWKAHTYQTEGHYVEWTQPAPADVKEFIVYSNTSASDTGAVEVSRTANLNTIVPYLDGYDYFGVQAVDWSGNNKSAIVWSAKYDPTPTGASPLTVTMAEFGGFIMSYTAVTLGVTYEVQGATDSSGTGTVTVWTGNTLTTPVVKVTGQKWFRVRALGYDNSPGPWSAWGTDTNPPPQPQMYVVNGQGQTTLALAVNDTSAKSVGFSHYKVEIADDENGLNASTYDAHALASSFPLVLAQAEGTIKYYRLTPYDWADNAGTPTLWQLAVSRGSSESATVQDKFDGYGGKFVNTLESLYWLSIESFDSLSGFSVVYPDTNPTLVNNSYLYNVEGANGLRMDQNFDNGLLVAEVSKSFNPAINLTERFTDDDYMAIYIYLPVQPPSSYTVWTPFNIEFYDGSGRQAYNTFQLYQGINYLVMQRSVFQLSDPAFDWTNITTLRLYLNVLCIGADPLPRYYVYMDDLRIIKADPDNSATYNDTGTAWDQAVSTGTDLGIWHIYEGNRTREPGKPYSYGQISHAASPTYWYLSHKPLGTNIVSGTIQTGVFHKENGKSGLAFFIKDVTPDEWTMYAIEADNVGDTVKLVKWVNGTRTELGSGSLPFISAAGGAAGQTVWIGADFSQYDSDAGRIKVYASATEGNLIQAANLKISVQDTEVGSGGTVGVLSDQTNVRFVNFTAGSPAHADVADVAKALDGPIIIGEQKRLVYDATTNRWAWTDDGGTTLVPLNAANAEYANEAAGAAYAYDAGDASNLGGIAAANYLQRVSAARPGVTRLYRRDNDSNYSVQVHYDGSRWWLRGYGAADAFHAECRVAYADQAGNADTLDNLDSTRLMATGSTLYRSNNLALNAGAWTVINWTGYFWNTGSYWNGATRLTATRAGWHIVSLQINLDSNGASTTGFMARILINGGGIYAQHNEKQNTSPGNSFITIAKAIYMVAGDYAEAYCNITGGGILNCSTAYALFSLISLEG